MKIEILWKKYIKLLGGNAVERFTEKGMQRKGTFQWGSLNLFSIASDPGADLDRWHLQL